MWSARQEHAAGSTTGSTSSTHPECDRSSAELLSGARDGWSRTGCNARAHGGAYGGGSAGQSTVLAMRRRQWWYLWEQCKRRGESRRPRFMTSKGAEQEARRVLGQARDGDTESRRGCATIPSFRVPTRSQLLLAYLRCIITALSSPFPLPTSRQTHRPLTLTSMLSSSRRHTSAW